VAESNHFLMSRSSTVSVNPAGQSVLGRLSNLRLASPALTVTLLMACVFCLRLPSALVPRELNVDESQMLSLAMKFMVDPRPWIAADTTSSGPLNSYLISVFLWVGFKPGFVLVHLLASVLVCLQVLMTYLTLRRLGLERTAALGAFLMVLLYGLATSGDYLHYSSELLPTLLLMVGFYILLVWLDEPAERRADALHLLFSGGLVLGTAPWCKLSAAPITGALGLVVLAAIFRDRGPSFSFSWRVMELIAFCVGGMMTTCVMLAILAKSGALEDFWSSYILQNLAYAGPFRLGSSILHFLFIFLVSPLHQLLLVALLGAGLLAYASRSPGILLLFKKKKWACIGLLVYVGAALFAVCRPRFFFPHYAILLVPPMTYLTAVIASPELASKSHQLPRRLLSGLVLVLLLATIGLYGAYVVRYAQMIKAIRELSHSQTDWKLRIAKVVPPRTHSSRGIAGLRSIPAPYIGPRTWGVTDSNERIAEAVRDIQKKRPVRSLAIWGSAPGVYVLTGIPPATRDSVGYSVITGGRLQKYFRARFVGDLREHTPDLFIDAVAPDALMWGWTANDGYESDPQLRKFIEDGYILVDELTLVRGAKPVRFFARVGTVVDAAAAFQSFSQTTNPAKPRFIELACAAGVTRAPEYILGHNGR